MNCFGKQISIQFICLLTHLVLHILEFNGLTSLCECICLNRTAAAQNAGNYYYAGNFCLFLSI